MAKELCQLSLQVNTGFKTATCQSLAPLTLAGGPAHTWSFLQIVSAFLHLVFLATLWLSAFSSLSTWGHGVVLINACRGHHHGCGGPHCHFCVQTQTNELHTEGLSLGADTQVPDTSCPQDPGFIHFWPIFLYTFILQTQSGNRTWGPFKWVIDILLFPWGLLFLNSALRRGSKKLLPSQKSSQSFTPKEP